MLSLSRCFTWDLERWSTLTGHLMLSTPAGHTHSLAQSLLTALPTMAEMQEDVGETSNFPATTVTYTSNTSEWTKKGWDKELVLTEDLSMRVSKHPCRKGSSLSSVVSINSLGPEDQRAEDGEILPGIFAPSPGKACLCLQGSTVNMGSRTWLPGIESCLYLFLAEWP